MIYIIQVYVETCRKYCQAGAHRMLKNAPITNKAERQYLALKTVNI